MIYPLILVATLIFLAYQYWGRNFNHWKQKGVPFLEPSLITGNFGDVFLFRISIGQLIAKFYKQFDTPYFGVFVLNKPFLVVRDSNLIKSVLVKDFNNFPDRIAVSDEKADPLAAKVLFAIKNPEWKTLRNKTTPIFTTGKIKAMLVLIGEVTKKMTTYIDSNCSSNVIEMKEVCAKYSTDVLATCVFGLDANCFVNENSEFRVMGKKIFEFSLKNNIRQSSYFLAHTLVRFFKIPFFDPSVSTFMREMIWSTIREREKGQYKRNDVIDIIIEMKNNKELAEELKFEGDTVVAQAVQFIVAGFETTSSTLSFTLYELCLHLDVQSKLRQEIKNAVEEHGSLTYEALQDMKYMHMVICETLRMYPVLPFLDRRCVSDYKFPGTDLKIDKGTPIFISLLGLHYDPEYFSEPEKFDPERFSDENKRSISQFTYFPFGEGPRNCIGERFGLMVVKMGLASLLLNYEFERTAETPVPMKFNSKSLTLTPVAGLEMRVKKITD